MYASQTIRASYRRGGGEPWEIPPKMLETILKITRQMMIIAGGEPKLCRRRHAKRKGGSMHPRMHYVSVSPVQNAVCMCCAYVGKCEKGLCEVTGEKN